MRRGTALRVTFTITLALLFGGLVPVATVSAGPVDDAIRYLGRTSTGTRDGSHLAMLLALRQLGDLELRPFFHKLVFHEQWQVQVHAVLALAELSDDGQVDPWLITQVQPAARERLIAEALDRGTLGAHARAELLAWPDLEPLGRLLLVAEQWAQGEPVDPADLQRLAENSDLKIAGIASCLLAQETDISAFSSFSGRLLGFARRTREELVLTLFDAIRQYRLDVMLDWVAAQAQSEDASAQIEYWGIFTLLAFDPARGVDLWNARLGDEPSYSRRIRFALLLLRTEPPLPAASYAPLRTDDPLLGAIADAGAAMAAAPANDPTPALIALIDQDHVRTAEWIMHVAESLPESQATRLYEHVVDRLERGREVGDHHVALAVVGVSRLFGLRPDLVQQRLDEAEDDGLTQQTIMLGLFDSTSPDAGAAVRGVRRIGAGRADLMALLLLARHDEPLTASDLRLLGTMAGGGGSLSIAMQTQAAWLYLKKVDAVDEALNRMFSE